MKDPTIVEEIHSIKPIFGDHLLISITVGWGGGAKVESINRDWRKYSKEVLLNELELIEWDLEVNNVQNMWDEFESKLVKVVDKIVPLTRFVNKKAICSTPFEIKRKFNIRKRLLKQRKRNPRQKPKS